MFADVRFVLSSAGSACGRCRPDLAVLEFADVAGEEAAIEPGKRALGQGGAAAAFGIEAAEKGSGEKGRIVLTPQGRALSQGPWTWSGIGGRYVALTRAAASDRRLNVLPSPPVA